MAILNPNFDEPGVSPGFAKHWRITAVTQAERIAAFGNPPKAREDFGDWFAHMDALEQVTSVVAIYDTRGEGLEDFEEGWFSEHYLFELPPALMEPVSIGVESMESGWSNDVYVRVWSVVASGVGVSDDFEAGWGGRDPFVLGVPVLEDFKGSWPETSTL